MIKSFGSTKTKVNRAISDAMRKRGYKITNIHKTEFPPDFDAFDKEIVKAVKPFTLTGVERIYALIRAVKYVVSNEIEGDFVECGVWRGGSMLTIALTLESLNCTDRNLYMFDTYEGMPEPQAVDKGWDGVPAIKKFLETSDNAGGSAWCQASLEDVTQVMENNCTYDKSKIHFVKGLVEDTVPQYAPDQVALLRLDTDWYSSTIHELNHLYPRLSHNGVLIIDDYGAWQGARKATDEYFAGIDTQILLNRIDYSARIAIKTA